MIRVRSGRREARVENGFWSGDRPLATLGRALEPLGGVSAAFPDPDAHRAKTLAKRTGGEVLDEPEPTKPVGGQPE